MELFLLYRLLLPIAGLSLVAVLFAAWARLRNRRISGPAFLASVLRLVQWSGILALAIALGWLGGYWLAEVGKPLHITAPYNDQVVNLRQQVTGTYRQEPNGQTLWVFVAPFRTPYYFPQRAPATLQANHTWSSLAFVGSPENTGQLFDIDLVLVDAQGRQAVDRYLATNDPNGLNGLPEGAVIVDKVTVWRK